MLDFMYYCQKNHIFGGTKVDRVEKLRKNSLIKVLFIFLYIGFYVGNTAFFHTHHYLTFSVTHSHPFLKTSEGMPGHTHDKASLDTIDQINLIAVHFVLFLFTLGIVSLLLSIIIRQYRPGVVLQTVNSYRLRAPPVFLLS